MRNCILALILTLSPAFSAVQPCKVAIEALRQAGISEQAFEAHAAAFAQYLVGRRTRPVLELADVNKPIKHPTKVAQYGDRLTQAKLDEEFASIQKLVKFEAVLVTVTHQVEANWDATVEFLNSKRFRGRAKVVVVADGFTFPVDRLQGRVAVEFNEEGHSRRARACGDLTAVGGHAMACYPRTVADYLWKSLEVHNEAKLEIPTHLVYRSKTETLANQSTAKNKRARLSVVEAIEEEMHDSGHYAFVRTVDGNEFTLIDAAKGKQIKIEFVDPQ